MKEIEERLLLLQDTGYIDFEAKLNPILPRESFLGIRVPELRRYAVELEKSPLVNDFLEELPHRYFDENLLHAILLSRIRPFGRCLSLVKAFLRYVDNWAVCDTLRPKVFEKDREALLPEIRQWVASDHTYTCRFGVDMLMTYYLGEYFRPEYPDLVAGIRSEEYYVRMMNAWYFATALSKNWEAVIPYLENDRLPVWTHNKTIQKAKESFRITDEQKSYLNTLRR